MEIVEPGNRRRQETLQRLGRLFSLRHYWRVLHRRHATACRRRTGKLELAFAGYFGVNLSTVRGDLQCLRDRLGGHWV